MKICKFEHFKAFFYKEISAWSLPAFIFIIFLPLYIGYTYNIRCTLFFQWTEGCAEKETEELLERQETCSVKAAN